MYYAIIQSQSCTKIHFCIIISNNQEENLTQTNPFPHTNETSISRFFLLLQVIILRDLHIPQINNCQLNTDIYILFVGQETEL